MPVHLLALDSSTDTCSVALLADGAVVAEFALYRPRAHSENLVPMIDDVLRYGGLRAAELDAVAVGRGPGSYTGLRIGASTAKGLAAATDARLVAVPSLEAVAAATAAHAEAGDLVCAAFDARRDEVYAAAYLVEADRSVRPVDETIALTAEEAAAWLEVPSTRRLWLVGEGAAKIAEALERAGDRPFVRPPANAGGPAAGWVGRLGAARLARGVTEDVALFEPFYLKEFVAKKPSSSIFERLPF